MRWQAQAAPSHAPLKGTEKLPRIPSAEGTGTSRSGWLNATHLQAQPHKSRAGHGARSPNLQPNQAKETMARTLRPPTSVPWESTEFRPNALSHKSLTEEVTLNLNSRSWQQLDQRSPGPGLCSKARPWKQCKCHTPKQPE
jgi:hypothetical protein